MLTQLSIPKKSSIAEIDETTAPFEYEQLFVIGLEYIERLSRRIWNDYNVHDPGITTLELLSYAITDLSYRASFSMKDLLASSENNEAEMAGQFFTARQILPNRALTEADYRKLLIDIVGVQNAWIIPTTATFYADTVAGELLTTDPGSDAVRQVDLRGLYDVMVEIDDEITDPGDRAAVLAEVDRLLQANRNLCEDFNPSREIPVQLFTLCAELELAPDADTLEVHAQILYQVDEYLAPMVRQYTLDEMLAMTTSAGTLYTADGIFDGPLLDHGFIPDEELEASELRTDIRLSDIINIIMDVEGVKAVREIMFNPTGATQPLEDRWVIPVIAGHQALLDRDSWRLVSYKQRMPFTPDEGEVNDRWLELETSSVPALNDDDFAIPLGTYRDPGEYYSFQNHFPALYGVGPTGPPSGADDERRAKVFQLKGYLLFFDQLLAGYLAQLRQVRDLFSTDETLERTYFHQVVDSFRDHEEIYNVATEDLVDEIETNIDDADVLVERRNRFLDHMIARFAERFSDFANVMYDEFGASSADMIPYKCRFLAAYPAISGERSMAYNYTLTSMADIWETDTNISGLERRLGALLGITDLHRRNLSDDAAAEGMYVVENILLRPTEAGDPFMPICPDPNCADCSDEDPYSYRVNIILPAYGPRFGDLDFRRWAERVIRDEVPAHILAKICWITQNDMSTLADTYLAWLMIKAGVWPGPDRAYQIEQFIRQLYHVNNVYPAEVLHACTDPEGEPRFILGRSALGSQPPAGGVVVSPAVESPVVSPGTSPVVSPGPRPQAGL